MWINTEAHKRILFPNYGRYSCYTTRDNGVFVLRNGLGETIYKFKDENEKNKIAQGMVNVLHEIYLLLQKDYMAHWRAHPEYYEPTYEEANFTHKAIIKGFQPFPDYFNPYSNWYGVSGCSYPGYTPDAMLERGNKKIVLSKQGITMPFPDKEIEGFWNIAKQGDLKYLGFYIDDAPVYQTWFGELPSDEFIEDFIK